MALPRCARTPPPRGRCAPHISRRQKLNTTRTIRTLFTYAREKRRATTSSTTTRPACAPPPRGCARDADLARSARRSDLRLLALASFLALLGTWSAQPGLRTRVRSGGPGLLYKGADAPGARLYIVCSLLCGMGATGEPGGAGATQTFCCSTRRLVMGTIQINTCCLSLRCSQASLSA